MEKALKIYRQTLEANDEKDASNVAISATLNQNGKPVVFFSRTLNKLQKIKIVATKQYLLLI